MRLNKSEIRGDGKLVLFNECSIFIPFVCSLAIGLSALHILLRLKKRRIALRLPHGEWLAVWAAAATAAGLAYRNYLGVGLSLVMFLYIIYAAYCAAVITERLREQVIRLLSALSVAGLTVAFVQWLLLKGRVSSTFYNPNYYGYFCEIAFLACVYALFVYPSRRRLHMAGMAANVLGIWLAGCYFAWLAACLGVLALFLCLKRYGYFFIGLTAVAAYGAAVWIVPALLPRTHDFAENVANRLLIWKMSLSAFRGHPVFGEGFLTFMLISPGLEWPLRPHAHNIPLDLLLNYGIFGSSMLCVFFAFFISGLIKGLRRNAVNGLVLAVFLSTLVHGIIDAPVIGFQTGALFLLMLAIAETGKPAVLPGGTG